MHNRVITSAGTVFLVSGFPAWAQPGKAPSISVAASVPAETEVVKIPDPAWFLAGLVTGLFIGILIPKVFAFSKPRH